MKQRSISKEKSARPKSKLELLKLNFSNP